MTYIAVNCPHKIPVKLYVLQTVDNGDFIKILNHSLIFFRRRPAWTDRILFRVNSYNYEDENIELSLEAFNYRSHRDEMYRKSDHYPVSKEFKISVFGKTLGQQKQVDAYGPPIKFHKFSEPW